MAQLALLGGPAVGAPPRPQYPQFSSEAIARVTQLLQSGQTVALGRNHPDLAEAEARISAFHSGRHALALNSGHAALMCGLMGLGIGPGDEVVTTPYTWGASVSCILAVGATPVFADVDPISGLLETGSVEASITPRTRAILAVHLYGQPANMPELQRIARARGLAVLEDGSQAHGATIDGEVVGNFSDAAAFSCMGFKLLATSEAGYLVSPDESLVWKAGLMCQHKGRSDQQEFPKELLPYVDSLVYTFRLSPLVAALFPSQLDKLPAEVANRQANAALLKEVLETRGWIRFPELPEGYRSSFHYLTLCVDTAACPVSRDRLLQALSAEGLDCTAYVPAPIYRWRRLAQQGYSGPVPHWQPQLRCASQDYATLRLPGCEQKVSTSIELSWNFTERSPQAMNQIAEIFHKVFDHVHELRTI